MLNAFQPGNGVRAVVTKRMSEVADASVLILDLRDNDGGDPAIVAYVASYLFDPPRVHLNDMWWRDDGSTFESWTVPDVPGNRFGGEEAGLRAHERQDVLGRRRARVRPSGLAPREHRRRDHQGWRAPRAPEKLSPTFTLRVPTGRAINPITRTNWEGVGVKPDVDVPAERALEEALRQAGKG